MNLQFISIGNRNGLEVAYFLDQNTSTVYAFRVVDMTGNATGMNTIPLVPHSTGGPVPVPMTFSAPAVHTPEGPVQKTRSIMPPGMADLMRPDGPPPGI